MEVKSWHKHVRMAIMTCAFLACRYCSPYDSKDETSKMIVTKLIQLESLTGDTCKMIHADNENEMINKIYEEVGRRERNRT